MLEELPRGRMMDAESRQAAQDRLTQAGILKAGYYCSDMPSDVVEFVILPFPETLRISSYGADGTAGRDVDGVYVMPFVMDGPDVSAATSMFVVENSRCQLYAVIRPEGLEVPAQLAIIDTLTKHLRAGRVEEVEARLDSLPDWNERDTFGDTLLTAAAGAGADALVAAFLERGADIEKKDRTGASALTRAVSAGHISTVQLLLERGANPDSLDNLGYTPMIHAAVDDYVEIMELLKNHDATIRAATDEKYFGGGATALHRAAIFCRENAARWLLENGADVDATDAYGSTPLIGMASRKCVDVAQLLIDHGADVNARCEIGTALGWAATFGSLEMVTLLVESGAEVGLADIRAAQEKGRTEIVAYLEKMR